MKKIQKRRSNACRKKLNNEGKQQETNGKKREEKVTRKFSLLRWKETNKGNSQKEEITDAMKKI